MALLNIGFSAVATGTSDAITATYSPAITLSNRRIVFLRITAPNETFDPTFNPNGLGAKPIRRAGGLTLYLNDLVGDCILMFNESGDYWELLNPKASKYIIAGPNGAYAYDRVIPGGIWEASAGDDDFSGTLQISPGNIRILHDVAVEIDAPSVTKNGVEVATESYVDAALQSANIVRVVSETTSDQTVVTGTTNNTISYAAQIPANTFAVGKNPRINGRVRFAGSAGTRAVRIYINSSADLSGATLIGTIGATLSSSAFDVNFSRMFTIKSSTVTEFINVTTSIISADGAINAAVSNVNIDWTQGQYIIYAIQLANGSDSGVVSGSKITT